MLHFVCVCVCVCPVMNDSIKSSVPFSPPVQNDNKTLKNNNQIRINLFKQ